MGKSKNARGVEVRIVKADMPINKAENTTQLNTQDNYSAFEWITPPVPMRGYKAMVEHSSILPQCIRAYKSNIAGFGIGVRYKENLKENAEMRKEFDRAMEVLENLNLDMDTKEVFEHVVEARETYGTAYLEVIRDGGGEVVGVDFIEDTPSIEKTIPLEPYVDVEYMANGEAVKRKKRFRKYKQSNGIKTVYFKEMGDPRIMDSCTGEYAESLDIAYQANEILEFAIGTAPYGEVRWIGQVLGVNGSRKAEELNNRYFEEGRHTPMMIMVKGGKLTDSSFDKLREYMNDIKGEKGQHAFMVLEVEDIATNTPNYDPDKTPDVEIKDLASILQKDELFQDCR